MIETLAPIRCEESSKLQNGTGFQFVIRDFTIRKANLQQMIRIFGILAHVHFFNFLRGSAKLARMQSKD